MIVEKNESTSHYSLQTRNAGRLPEEHPRERAEELRVRYDWNLGLAPLLEIANSNTRGIGLLKTHRCAVRERSRGTRY